MLRETEVDGVRTVLAPVDGPLRAGLTFRVGRADETLARAGITHLLQHLVLSRHGVGDPHRHGDTGPVTTQFHLRGSPAEVVAFLAGVCGALADPPFHRLDSERSALRTEAAGRGPSPLSTMPLRRYGARSYGLTGLDEVGLPAIRAADLLEWARTWFTRGNAVLWIGAAEVPAGLTLPLPEGSRRPVPAPTFALPRTPAYYTGPGSMVGFDAVVRRRPAAGIYAAMLARDLDRALRQEGGPSSAVHTSYDPRGDGHATVTAAADASPARQDAVLGGCVDVLARYRLGRIAEADLDSVRGAAFEALRDGSRLPSAAFDLLTGAPVRSADELRAGLAAVTLDGVREVAAEAHANGLLMAPRGCVADWGGYVAAPSGSDHTVDGRRLPLTGRADSWLVIGPAGVSAIERGAVTTVRFDACVAMLTWPDGGRHLVGADGLTVRVEPTLVPLPPGTIARLDAAVPSAARVALPARHPGGIPAPPAAGAAPTSPVRGTVLGALLRRVRTRRGGRP
jgi:zinc protease